MKELERSLGSAKHDLCTVQSEQRTLRAKEIAAARHPQEPSRTNGGDGRRALPSSSELTDLTWHCNGERRRMNILTAKSYVATASAFTMIGNRWTAKVWCDAYSRDVTTERYQVNQIQAAQTVSGTEVDISLSASNFCCSTIRCAVDSPLRTFMSTLYEPCHGNVMSVIGDNGCAVYSDMAAEHIQRVRLRGRAEAIRA